MEIPLVSVCPRQHTDLRVRTVVALTTTAPWTWASATWTRRDQSFLQNRHTERAYGSRYCDAAHKQQGTPIPVYDASKKCG